MASNIKTYDLTIIKQLKLLDMQNLIFPIVFSILHKTPNATYIILFYLGLLSFILSLFFNPAPGCNIKLIYFMLCLPEVSLENGQVN